MAYKPINVAWFLWILAIPLLLLSVATLYMAQSKLGELSEGHEKYEEVAAARDTAVKYTAGSVVFILFCIWLTRRGLITNNHLDSAGNH